MGILSGVRWYEWLFIAVLLVVGPATYWFVKDYRTTIEENKGLALENTLRTEEVKHERGTHALADKTVAEFVEERDETRVTNEQTRKEVMDEYLDQRARSEPATPADPFTATPIPPLPGVGLLTDDPAFRRLLDGLRQETCRARSGNQVSGCTDGTPATGSDQ